MSITIVCTSNLESFASEIKGGLLGFVDSDIVIIIDEVTDHHNGMSSETYFEFVRQHLENASLIIAEISEPSTGIGYQLSYANSLEKPVYCFAQNFVTDPIINFIDNKTISFYQYSDIKEVVNYLRSALSDGSS